VARHFPQADFWPASLKFVPKHNFRLVRHSGRIRSLAASTSTFLAENVLASDILAIVGAADPFNVIAARRLKESCRNE